MQNNRCFTKKILTVILITFISVTSFGQSYIKGVIKDSLGKKLSLVSVSLIVKQTETGIDFVLTNEGGEYFFIIPDTLDLFGLAIRVNAVGFVKAVKRIITKKSVLDFILQPEKTELPHVTVKSALPRISIKGDTLSYSASAFSDKADRVIGDIIKKLPGVEVEENGMIKYQGKPINYFYIDGDNILDDKYSIATKNIPSDIVEKIQVIENNQHIKMLNGIVASDRAALNITLKDNAKINLINTVKAGIGVPSLFDGEFNNMAFKSRFKAINGIKYNNIGSDLSKEAMSLNSSDPSGSFDNRGTDNVLTTGIAGVPANIPASRLLFNNAALFNINTLFKSRKDVSIRVNASYMLDKQNQNYVYFADYFLPTDTVNFLEKQQLGRKLWVLNGTITTNVNTGKRYFNNAFSIDYTTGSDESYLQSNNNTITQSLNGSLKRFANNLTSVKFVGSQKFIEIASFTSYENKLQELSVTPGLHQSFLNKNNAYLSTLQNIRIPVLFTNNYMSYKVSNRQLFQTYKVGIVYQGADMESGIRIRQFSNMDQSLSDSFVNQLTWHKTRFYTDANFRYDGQTTTLNFSLPVGYTTIRYQDPALQARAGINRVLFTPVFRFQTRINRENMINGSYQYATQLSNMNEIYKGIIMSNYQTFLSNDIPIQQTNNHIYNAGFEFKKTIKLLFVNLFYTYSERQADFIYAFTLQNNIIKKIIVLLPNVSYNNSLSINISKYLFNLKTTLFAKYSYQHTQLQQLQNGLLFPVIFSSHNIDLNATVKPTGFISLRYESKYIWTSSKSGAVSVKKFLTTRNYFNRQQVEFDLFIAEKISFKSRTELYYYLQPDQQKLSFMFSDFTVRYSLNKKLSDIELGCSNLFNTYEYRTISAEDNSVFGASYLLRPRSILLRASFRF